MFRTQFVKVDESKRDWLVVDATGITLGRLAAQVAMLLRGKHKPSFSTNQDVGDHVVIINADKVRLTGNKGEELIYWHTMWPGGLRSVKRGDWLEDKPVKLVEKVVWGMLPKTKLGRAMYKKLKVYSDDVHPHVAQNPKTYVVK